MTTVAWFFAGWMTMAAIRSAIKINKYNNESPFATLYPKGFSDWLFDLIVSAVQFVLIIAFVRFMSWIFAW